MAFELTENAKNATSGVNIKPQLVLEVDGVSTIFGAAIIKKKVKIGDVGLTIGGGWTIGGLIDIEDQEDLITFDGTSTSIRQQLLPDKGAVSSISSLSISLIDKDVIASNLISPGQTLTEILGASVKVYLGFEDTAFPSDYIEIFAGFISDTSSGAGFVVLDILHPDDRKRQDAFEKADSPLSSGIDAVVTTIPLADASEFLTDILGPDGLEDPTFRSYVLIGDELIRYTGSSGNSLTGATRGEITTTAATHDSGDDVQSFYYLESDAIDICLKFMLSGWGGPFKTAIAVENFNRVSPTELVTDAIFFENIDVEAKYGIVEGDYVSTTGASNGANNVTLKTISQIFKNDFGSYIVMNGVTFVEEVATSAILDFRSKYDTLPTGLKMSPFEVDVLKHESLRQLFLASTDYRFYLKETIDGKDFIEKQIYSPVSAYSLPLRGKSSIGLHVPPFDLTSVAVVDKTNIKNPSKLKMRRGIKRNFTNSVSYRWDEAVLSDTLVSGKVYKDATSLGRIVVGAKHLKLQARGMRGTLQAAATSLSAANRRLKRYGLAARYFEKMEVLYSVGMRIEPGDFILFDPADLSVTNLETGSRDLDSQIYEVTNRTLNIVTGKVTIDIVDTEYDGTERYGLISPASKVSYGTSGTEFVIKESFASKFGTNEHRKWTDLVGASVLVRKDDFTVSGTAIVASLSGNTVTLESTVGFTPLADYIMELDSYDNQPDKVKLIYTFMSDAAFSDGKPQYLMI